MLPRLSTKVHPSSSNSTAADYACLPSPSAPPVEAELPKSTVGQNGREWTRWLYNYPRLSFVLLFVLCTYIGGIFVSTKVTAWTLSVLGVDGELANARQVYLASSQRLKSMTECVDRSSLEYLAAAKLQYEVDSKRVQKIIDANDDVLSTQRNATMTCSAAFLTSLKEQVQIPVSASDDVNSTLSCFSDRFYENVPDTNSMSSSRALVLAVRALLTTQAVTAANDSVSKQQIQFENQLVDMWKSVDSVKTSIDKTLSAMNTLTSEQLSSLAPILSDKDGEGHTKQSALRLGRLSKVVSSELSDPLASTSSTSLEAIRKAGRTLHTALEFLSGLHEGLSDVMDTVDGTWQLLEKQLNATAQQAVQLQKELAYAAESTAQQINRTTSAILTSFGQAQQEIATSFDILHQHWQNAVSKLVAQGFTPWHRLGDRLVAELTANQRQSVRPENSIRRKYILPDRTTNSSLETERARLAATAARYEDPQASNSSASADNGDEFDIDTAVLRASLVDIGAFVTQVIFYADVGRLTLMVADLAVGLISESYSDMPMLDIRGITTADTIGSVCGVFLCKHSVWTVCCVIVANASELMRVLVRFVLLLTAASVVTAGLFMWKQVHIEHCGGAVLPSSASPTVIQSITRAYFENKGNTSNSVVDPLDEIERYTTIINDSIRNDYAALELDSAAVWTNQSAALRDFGDCATTTSTLVRMLQDCSQQVSSEDSSLSSQCLTSELRNTSGIVTPSKTATQLSENAPYLAPSNAFELCFPEETTGRTVIVNKLQHDLACATEKAVYLSCASWWVLVVIFVANRFAMRMVIKAAGVYWWRFLSADRLQFVGFCREDGDIVASNTLPLAIQQHLRVAKWQIIGRFVGIGFAFTCVVVVLIAVFQGMV